MNDDHDFRTCRCESCQQVYSDNFDWRIWHEDRIYEKHGPKEQQ